MPDTLTPQELRAIRERDAGIVIVTLTATGRTMNTTSAELDRRALLAHIDALTAAVENQPRWSMVGEMNNRHMEAMPNGHYFDAAAVLAILRGEQ